MAEPAPTNVSVTFHLGYHTLNWTNNDTYDEIHIWRSLGGEGSSYYATVSGSNTGYDDYSVGSNNTSYEYKLKAYRDPYLPSPFSDTATLSRYKDILSETVTLATTLYDPTAFLDAISDTITPTVTYTDKVTYLDAVSDTITIGDVIGSFGTVTIRSDTQYIIGDSTGELYIYGPAYTSDNGDSIASIWTSKTWDGSEQGVELSGNWKTIYKITHYYSDKSSATPVEFSISDDGGTTWDSQTKYVGTGTGKIDSTDYHVLSTGQFFQFRVTWTSTDKTFQFLGFNVVYEVMSDQFEVS
jgi:hypothetical protein